MLDFNAGNRYNINMKAIVQPLRDKSQTGKSLYDTVYQFYDDCRKCRVLYKSNLVPFSALSLSGAFDYVRKLPYRRDGRPVEVVARPKYILSWPAIGYDCKKKGILMASWLHLHGIPFRFMTLSRLPSGRIHHVYPQAWLNGAWRNVDATYAEYQLFEPKEATNAEVLT
jgi:hypothetical protein